MKKYFYPLCLGMVLSLPMFGQWTLLGSIKNVPSDVYELERFKMKKSGEKFGYNDVTGKKYKLFNRDGSTWKSYSGATQAQCIGAQQFTAPFWNRQALSSNSDFEYVFSCNEDPATGLRNFGIADETGKTIHLFSEKLGDVIAYNSGVFTMSKPLTGNKADTLRNIDFYKNNNGVLTKTKSFTNTRFVGEVESQDPKLNGTHYFELTKDRNLIIYNKDWTVFKTIAVTLWNGVSFAAVKDFSKGILNTDDKWDMELVPIGKDGFTSGQQILDETGRVLGKTFQYYYDIRGKVFSKDSETSNPSYDSLFSLPQRQLLSVIKSGDLKDNTRQFTNISQKFIITEITNPDSIVTMYDEKKTKLKTLKIVKPNYKIGNAEVIEQPDKSLVTVVLMYHKTTFEYAIRIIYPNNTVQDLDGFSSFRVAEEGDLEDRIIFRKSNANNTNDFAIYSFGNLSNASETLSLEGVHIFPNPTEGSLNVKIDGSGDYQFCLFDLMGKTYWQANSKGENVLEINVLQQANNGIYLLEVKDEQGKRTVQRVVKQ